MRGEGTADERAGGPGAPAAGAPGGAEVGHRPEPVGGAAPEHGRRVAPEPVGGAAPEAGRRVAPEPVGGAAPEHDAHSARVDAAADRAAEEWGDVLDRLRDA